MSIDASLYTAAQVRELDRRAIEQHGVAGATLMARAGEITFRALRARFPRARKLAVVCGPGNNGGDGYVVARLARQAGLDATTYAVGATGHSADAAAARRDAQDAGVVDGAISADGLQRADVVVDALLGTGLTRAVRGEWREAIGTINACGKPVVAVDIPSGLNADTGAVMGAAVRARLTVSFIGLKVGLFTAAGREYVGEILFDSLRVPVDIYSGIAPAARRLAAHDFTGYFTPRPRDAHKGSLGRVLVVGGGVGMPGAARLCGEAAYRAGAGLVSLATHPSHAAVANAGRPELLAYPVRSAAELKPLLVAADAIALGPGLSRSSWAGTLWRAALASKRPLVVDADALNLLAARPMKRADWVLTPHPGEAARLLNTTAEKIQQNRLDAVRRLVKRYGGVCVLKGSGTLIASANDADIRLCDRGNPGMASGGTGDVLTGVIAALRARGLDALDAACVGVWLHASAGDAAAREAGEVGLLASDLIGQLRRRIDTGIA